MTVHRASDRLSAHRATNVYSRTIYLVWEHKTKLIAHQCCDLLTGIRWPVSPDRTAGLSVHPSMSRIFWSYPLTNYQVQMIEGSSLFFPMIHMKYVVFISLWPRTIRILISNWPRTRKFRQLLKNTGGEDLFFTMVTHWSRFTSTFYALIGQNLTVEFMRKIYAASWKLFTLTAEADKVLCQLVVFLTVFLTVFFLWM